MKTKPDQLTFSEHLEELRGRLIKVLVTLAVCCFIVAFYVDKILTFFIRPIGTLIFTSPAEAFLAHMTLIFVGGFTLSVPITLYQGWQFMVCGLTTKEKRYAFFFVPLSTTFFLLGLLFGYFVILPIALKFLLGFSNSMIRPMITIGNYVSFVCAIVLVFGLVFQFPLGILFLTKLGLVRPSFLIEKRRYAIVLIFIISALLTPPDCITQLLMAGPLILLYELSIFLSKVFYRSNLTRED
ncbi:MAG: twin-arginine translocase subunit TatC [Candidatus Omnitrophota bacterium]